MNKILSFCLSLVSVIFLIGCTVGNSGDSKYAVTVVITNEGYDRVYESDEAKVIEGQIGTIAEKTNVDAILSDNQSNHFEVGSKIYSVKGTKDYIIVIDKNNEEHLLKKAVPQN
jgi:hypothetical protein